MAAVAKIDSNITGLRIAEELSLGVLPGTPIWVPYEPNDYKDFGGQITTVARKPINPSRQRKKGVVTDLDASGGFSTDITQTNLQELLQGFFFADLLRKAELAPTAVAANAYTVASGGTGYVAGDLLFAKGFGVSGNNGLKAVSGTPTGTSVTVSAGASVEASPPSGATISRVGFQFAAADATITLPGGFPALNATVKNLTTLGLSVGEWIYIGDDNTANSFAQTANNGYARIRSITATQILFDKTDKTMVADAGTGKTIRIYFGRVLKNQTGSLIKRRTYQVERTLGAPDDAQLSQIQSEYLTGAVPSQAEIKVGTADKVTAQLTFLAQGSELRTGVTGVKSGTRPALVESSAFNTSSDFSRIRLAQVDTANSNPTPLFAYVTEAAITINNNVSAAKAVSVLGAFDMTAGTFEVGGSLTAYFADVTAISAVRNNADITLDFTIAKENGGITFDIPLISLGDGRPNVKQDEAITLPLGVAAATGAKINANLDYTMMIIFWDYLPNVAL